jgi:hypothetical protein
MPGCPPTAGRASGRAPREQRATRKGAPRCSSPSRPDRLRHHGRLAPTSREGAAARGSSGLARSGSRNQSRSRLRPRRCGRSSRHGCNRRRGAACRWRPTHAGSGRSRSCFPSPTSKSPTTTGHPQSAEGANFAPTAATTMAARGSLGMPAWPGARFSAELTGVVIRLRIRSAYSCAAVAAIRARRSAPPRPAAGRPSPRCSQTRGIGEAERRAPRSW